jgi:hypothetical protein
MPATEQKRWGDEVTAPDEAITLSVCTAHVWAYGRKEKRAGWTQCVRQPYRKVREQRRTPKVLRHQIERARLDSQDQTWTVQGTGIPSDREVECIG